MNYKAKLSVLGCAVIFLNVSLCVSRGAEKIEPLINPELLKAANLRMVWENQLPIKQPQIIKKFPFKKFSKGEKIKDMQVMEGRLYCLSDRNYFISLNREKGNIVFSKPMATAGLPVIGYELYDDQILSAIGGKLVELNKEFGQELASTQFGYGMICTPARNKLYYYLGGDDEKIHAIRVKDKVEFMKVAASNQSEITAVAANDNFVVFSTNAGNIISIEPDKAVKRWEYATGRAINGPMILEGKDLYFSSRDTNVYKFNAEEGKFIWKVEAGSLLEKSPTVTKDVLYQPTVNRGLLAIDKKTGKQMWQLSEGKDLLAESGDKAYVITRDGKLAVMDNQKAKKLYSVNFLPVSKYAINTIDSYIYAADDRGHVVCLKPIE